MQIEDEYIDLLNELETVKTEMETDTRLHEIDREIKRLQDEREKIVSRYSDQLTPISERISEIEEEFKRMYSGEKKKRLDRLVLNFRETKSLKVRDKQKVVEVLLKNNQVEQGVRSFALSHLRKLADVGILPEGSYEYERKINVKVEVIE